MSLLDAVAAGRRADSIMLCLYPRRGPTPVAVNLIADGSEEYFVDLLVEDEPERLKHDDLPAPVPPKRQFNQG